MSAETSEVYARLRDVELKGIETRVRLDAHEDKCSVRYEQIFKAMENMSRAQARTHSWLLRVGFALLAGTAGILAKIVFYP